MKTLVVYYSRTGVTRKVAESIAKNLDADLEEIRDDGRKGLIGWLKSGIDAIMRKASKIEDVRKFPGNYDITIIGTPIWAGNMASPVRSYLEQFGDRIEKTAFYATCGSSAGKTFAEIESIVRMKPLATLELRMNDVKSDSYKDRLDSFLEEINKKITAPKEAPKEEKNE